MGADGNQLPEKPVCRGVSRILDDGLRCDLQRTAPERSGVQRSYVGGMEHGRIHRPALLRVVQIFELEPLGIRGALRQ